MRPERDILIFFLYKAVKLAANLFIPSTSIGKEYKEYKIQQELFSLFNERILIALKTHQSFLFRW